MKVVRKGSVTDFNILHVYFIYTHYEQVQAILFNLLGWFSVQYVSQVSQSCTTTSIMTIDHHHHQ